jgi:hypothetical protein
MGIIQFCLYNTCKKDANHHHYKSNKQKAHHRLYYLARYKLYNGTDGREIQKPLEAEGDPEGGSTWRWIPTAHRTSAAERVDPGLDPWPKKLSF